MSDQKDQYAHGDPIPIPMVSAIPYPWTKQEPQTDDQNVIRRNPPATTVQSELLRQAVLRLYADGRADQQESNRLLLSRQAKAGSPSRNRGRCVKADRYVTGPACRGPSADSAQRQWCRRKSDGQRYTMGEESRMGKDGVWLDVAARMFR